ncbi:MAG: O-antigen ligase family protein [Bacteroidaceae bacterium]|nr:O-antigen ligase family protein [Bacteroidaceae bacterium]
MLLHYFRHRLPLLIQAFAVGFSIAVYCNAVNMALHPEWLFTKEIDGFLLGVNYNQMGCRLICAVITNILCLRINKWWIINVIFLTIIAIATLLLVNSMTSFSCLTLFVLLCFVPSVQLKKIFAIGIFAFVLLFEFVVVFSGESLANNELAVYIIVDVLGKDITFTLRTELWDAGMKLFAESPFIGYGLVDNEWYRTHMVARAIGPHNMILGIMINGGLTLLTLMGMYITVAVKNSYKQIDNMLATLLMGIGFCFMMMTMEVYPSFFLFYLFALVYYYPQLQGIIDSKKSKK